MYIYLGLIEIRNKGYINASNMLVKAV